MKRLTYLLLTTILLSCGHHATTNDEVYNLMAFVIEDQQLNKTYGIKIEPEERCTLDKTDEEFLNTLILDDKESDSSHTLKLRTLEMTYEIGQLSKCLTKEDVRLMLGQKREHGDFKWDNSRLGFNTENKSSWYVFSVPLVSKDGTEAVMMIRELCTGLCGRGWTLLLKKENGRWTSQTGKTWRH